jgi:hypothetical protein
MFSIRSELVRATVLSIWMFLLVVGCQPVINDDVGTEFVTEAHVTEQAGSSLNTRSLTPVHAISQTVTSTVTSIPPPTASSTPWPTPTLLPTETVMPTPWPTLPADEAVNRVLSLLADNQNPDCLLPCWWGATPGQTRWQDIEPFLRSFAQEIHYSSSETSFGAEVHLPLPNSVPVTNLSEFRTFYGWKESGVIYGISIDSINISGFDPVTMMSLYGIPDEVWIKTLDAPREEVLPFQLIIVYQQQGISFRYYANASTDGETITACFEPGFVELEYPDLFPAGPRIYLWEPGQHKTIDEIANIPREIYFPLAEKTDLTPQTLYEKFTSSDEQPCIDTPADSWRDY